MHYAHPSRTAAAILSISLAIMVAALFAAFRDTAPWRPPPAAHAADPPGNDNFNHGRDFQPTEFGDALPYDDVQLTAGATLEDGESAPCAAVGATVWYAYRPAEPGTLALTTAGSDFDTVLTVYTAKGWVPSPPGQNLVSAGCDDNSGGGQTSALSIPVTPDEQYFVQVGGKDSATGQLHLHAACDPACRPSNDDVVHSRYAYLDAYRPAAQYHADTGAATLEPGESRACGDAGATVWYSFQAQSSMTLALDTAGSDFDTTLAVFAYNDVSLSPPGALTPVACDDNGGGGGTSSLSVHLDANQTFWIQAGGAHGAHGQLLLNMACKPGCPPYNDDLQNASQYGAELNEQVSTAGATTQAGEPQPCGGIGRTIWYDVQVQGDATVTLDTATSDFDTVIALYDQTGDSREFSDLHELKCVDNAGGEQAHLTFAAQALKHYLVQVGGHDGASGTLQFAAGCAPAACPPWGDDSSQPNGLYLWDNTPYSIFVDTRGATTQPGEPLDCGHMGRTVWFTLNSQLNAQAVIDTASSNYGTAIAVYDAAPASSPPGAPKRLACDAPGADGRARVTVPITPTTQLWVQVGGVDGASGDVQISVTCDPACPPHNDNSAAADQIGVADYYTSANTNGATLEPAEPQPCGGVGATVWYRFTTGERGGTLTVDATGSNFATAMAVYRMDGMSPPGALTNVACSDAGTLSAELAPYAVYYVQAGGAGGATGVLNLRFNCPAPGCAEGWIGGPDTGPGSPSPGGSINGPDTGSGGYLPGARRGTP